jgi:hypothetical protein
MNKDKSVFSVSLDDTLLLTAIVDEMARADNWQGLDECLVFKPETVKNFVRYATAALRALQKAAARQT